MIFWSRNKLSTDPNYKCKSSLNFMYKTFVLSWSDLAPISIRIDVWRDTSEIQISVGLLFATGLNDQAFKNGIVDININKMVQHSNHYFTSNRRPFLFFFFFQSLMNNTKSDPITVRGISPFPIKDLKCKVLQGSDSSRKSSESRQIRVGFNLSCYNFESLLY